MPAPPGRGWFGSIPSNLEESVASLETFWCASLDVRHLVLLGVLFTLVPFAQHVHALFRVVVVVHSHPSVERSYKVPEECRWQPWVHRLQQFKDRFHQYECRPVWIDDQVERSFRSSLIRVIHQPVAESEIEVKAPVNCNAAVFADPTLKSQGQVLGRISSAPFPVLNG